MPLVDQQLLYSCCPYLGELPSIEVGHVPVISIEKELVSQEFHLVQKNVFSPLQENCGNCSSHSWLAMEQRVEVL